MTEKTETIYTQILAALKATPEDHPHVLAESLEGLRAPDIAEVFELLSEEDRSRILYALPAHTTAEVIILLDEAVRGDVVDDLDTDSLTEIVAELPPDDAADMLGELSDEEVGEILDHMQDEQSDKIEELLVFDEETAGGIMTPDLVAVSANLTVADAVEQVRAASQDDDLHEVFIVDKNKRLIGTVPLRKLVTNAPDTLLLDLTHTDPVAVLATDDQETVLQAIRKYDVLEAAVLDNDNRLIGRVTHDDLLDVADEEAEEDLLRMAGTDAAELDSTSTIRAAWIRLKWLAACLVGMLITASVLVVSKGVFDVQVFAGLALFVPMIGAMGGNAGIQISTIIVRGFATGELGSTKLPRVVYREGRIALALAPACGLLAWLLVSLFFPFFSSFEIETIGFSVARLAIAVGTAMTAAILVAGFLGIAFPFSFRKIGIDPAIASGPLITTINDVISVSIYMLFGMAIIGSTSTPVP